MPALSEPLATTARNLRTTAAGNAPGRLIGPLLERVWHRARAPHTASVLLALDRIDRALVALSS